MSCKKIKDCILCGVEIAVILEQKKCKIHKNCFNHRHCYNFRMTSRIYHTKFPKNSVYIAPKSLFCFFCQKILKKNWRQKNKTKICACIVKKTKKI
jgi:hypothetical protein